MPKQQAAEFQTSPAYSSKGPKWTTKLKSRLSRTQIDCILDRCKHSDCVSENPAWKNEEEFCNATEEVFRTAGAKLNVRGAINSDARPDIKFQAHFDNADGKWKDWSPLIARIF